MLIPFNVGPLVIHCVPNVKIPHLYLNQMTFILIGVNVSLDRQKDRQTDGRRKKKGRLDYESSVRGHTGMTHKHRSETGLIN